MLEVNLGTFQENIVLSHINPTTGHHLEDSVLELNVDNLLEFNMVSAMSLCKVIKREHCENLKCYLILI